MAGVQTDFDVIQIGWGPVSKVAALQLDRMGWRVGVFERWGELYPLPRAVCIDHEVYRLLHGAGLGAIVDAVADPAPAYKWYNADWQMLLNLDWTHGSVSGGAETNFIHQPSFEARLHAEARRRAGIALNFDTECLGFTQHPTHVEVELRDTVSGARRKVTAKYLLGIDGANSTVRESLGIRRTDLGFEADWLVVDVLLREGLSWRDLGIIECGQYCNPARPTTIVPGGHDKGRECRRWEFMRLPQESRDELNDPARVRALLGDWIQPEQGDLVRHAVYTFRSLVADRWRDGRVLLLGDAAHTMPPFMGQGMCAGLRDVFNLAWKLDLVLKGAADAALLDSYEAERRPHVTGVIAQSIFLGSIICIPDPAAAAARDAMFMSGSAPPPAPFPHLTDGLLRRGADGAPTPLAGWLAPHGTVRHQRRTERFDALVPPGFTLVLDASLDPEDLPAAARAELAAQGVRMAQVVPKVGAPDDRIADTQGQILPFMAAHGVHALLVRPDFQIYGAAVDAAGLADLVAALAADMARFAPVAAAA